MDAIVSAFERIFLVFAQFGVTFMEMAGVVVLLISGINALVHYFRKDSSVRLKLARGIALSLEFKLGGEVLRTAIVREWGELGILGAVILLRVAMTILIHREIKDEEARFV
jgi:uncharacterized membrane protein